MKIAIGSDHGGFQLKGVIIELLKELGYEYEDFGTYSTTSCDYPNIAHAVAHKIVDGTFDRGILICGTGIGIGIAANKVPGIRAALCHDVFSAKACRAHNNANILTMGERIIGPGLACEIVRAFLVSEFEGGRHQRRVDLIESL